MLDNNDKVQQRDISAGRDNIGRDQNVTIHHSQRKNQIEGWLERLAREIDEKPEFRDFVDSLQYYLQKFQYDDVEGLENKLNHSGRGDQYRRALRKKEAFAKLLEEWRSFPAAQEIIAYFLAKIDGCFEAHIEPILETATRDDIDQIIANKLVDPVLEEMRTGPFMLNSMHVNGMVYWLAEQCYIRWHK
ncbi:hypothetical protein N9D37_01370 [Erythrobacter sp.]|nr:hypothetical protein [Erythrobacter sp.]